jgi:hypothetical protein
MMLFDFSCGDKAISSEADGCQNYPECWMREKFHGRHVMLCTSLYPYESSAGGGRIY